MVHGELKRYGNNKKPFPNYSGHFRDNTTLALNLNIITLSRRC